MKRCTIEFVNDYGSAYKVEAVYGDESVQYGDHIEVGELVNNLMKVAGFCYNKDMVFMESIDLDEYNYLADCLDEYRRDNKEGDSCD